MEKSRISKKGKPVKKNAGAVRLKAWKMFLATWPFVVAKTVMTFLPTSIFLVGLFLLFRTAYGEVYFDGGIFSLLGTFSTLGTMYYLGFFAVPLSLMFVVTPVAEILFRTVGRYLVNVGHVAVLASIATKGRVPERQLGWGMRAVAGTFGRVTVFFILNKMICRAIRELQMVSKTLLAGAGPLVLFVNMFKKKFIGYIDECCLAYTYMRDDIGPFQGAAKGLVVYVNGWRGMLTATLRVVLEMLVLGAVFYGLAGFVIFSGMREGDYIMVLAGGITAYFVRLFAKCFVDSYVMVNMLVAFINEADRQGEITLTNMMEVATLSRVYNSLLYQANQEEQFMDEDDEDKMARLEGIRPKMT